MNNLNRIFTLFWASIFLVACGEPKKQAEAGKSETLYFQISGAT